MANGVYLHEAPTPGRNRGRGRLVSGSVGVGLQGPASCLAPAPPSRRGICFHLALFTLQHAGCLRSADPSPQLLTGADEVLDRWL